MQFARAIFAIRGAESVTIASDPAIRGPQQKHATREV